MRKHLRPHNSFMDNNDSQKRVSLIVPVFNEENTLSKVLDEALRTSISEIVVVNDGSFDRSGIIMQKYAQKDQRIVLVTHKNNQGVGASRRSGIKRAEGNILCFFDADIKNPSASTIEKIYDPIQKNKADFVIAAFQNFGRVTELTAKPLLVTCFPDLAWLRQPISGQFAARRAFLYPERIEDGNAMLGILIDAYLNGARIQEVDIGVIEHSKRIDIIKKGQAIAECRACIKRFLESNSSLTFYRKEYQR